MSATVATIKAIVEKVKGVPGLAAQLADTADLLEEVGLDSLELLQFMLEVEERLAIRIDFDRLEYAYLHSIGDLAAFLDTMPASRPATGTA
jgi:acyl carrier protein